MGKDLYSLGREEFGTKDVVAVRANLKRRLEEKIELRECITNEAKSQNSQARISFDQGETSATMPSWQRGLRRRPNNLGLQVLQNND